MARPETKGFLEKHILDTLIARGWKITGSERKALDLDVFVEHAGIAGRVLFRNGFAQTGESNQASSPSFVRIDLGHRDDDVHQWSIWEEDVTLRIGDNNRTYDFAYQAAISTTWSSIAVSIRRGRPAKAWKAISFIEHAEKLSPAVDAVLSAKHIIERCKGASSFVSRGVTDLVGFVVALLCLGGLGAYLLSGVESGSTAYWAIAGVIALFSLVTVVLVIVIAILIAKRRSVAAASFSSAPFEAMLRDSGVFDRVEHRPAVKVMDVPVVFMSEHGPEPGIAPVARQVLRATSTAKELTTDLSMVGVSWPDGVVEDCRVVPDQWVVLEISASEEICSRLARGPREERSEKGVMWTVGGDLSSPEELREAIQLLVAAARGEEGAPYR